MFLVLPEKPVFFREEHKKFPSFYPPSKHVLRNSPGCSCQNSGSFDTSAVRFQTVCGFCRTRGSCQKYRWAIPWRMPWFSSWCHARRGWMSELGEFLKFPQRWIWQWFGGVCIYNHRVWSAHLGFWFRIFFFIIFFSIRDFFFGRGRWRCREY